MSDSGRSTASDGSFSRAAAWLLLLAVSWPMFFLGLGTVPLLDPDEPYYAVPALEMLRQGSWHVPLFHGVPWFDKPIFFYWIVMLAYRVGGVSALTTRVGSALAAVVGVLALFTLAERLGASRKGAIAAALILAANVEYTILARAAVTDMTLTAALTVGMALAAAYLETGRLRWAGLAGAAFGVAALTKGPVGLAIPVLALVLYAIVDRRSGFRWRAGVAAAAAAAVAVAGPWYAYMAVAHRALLVDAFLVEGNLGRFLKPEHVSGPLFYVAVFAAGLLPWSGALPAALVVSLRSAGGRLRGGLFCASWFLAVVLIFSLSASKLSSYVLPAFPPAALLVGSFWEGWFERRRVSRAAAVLAAVLGLVLAGAAALETGRLAGGPSWSDARRAWIAVASVLAASSLLALFAVLARRFALFLTAQTSAAVVVAIVLVYVAAPRLAGLHSAAPLVSELQRKGIADHVVGAFQVSRDFSLDFYLRRSLPRTDSVSVLRARVASGENVWVVPTSLVEPLKQGGISGELLAATPTLVAVRLRSSGSAEPGR